MGIYTIIRCLRKDIATLANSLHDWAATRIYPKRSLKTFDLVLVKTDGIGDFVLWTGLLKQICEHHRKTGKRILLITGSSTIQIPATYFTDLEVLAVDKKAFRYPSLYRWHLIRTLKGIRAQKVFNAVIARDTCVDDSIVAAVDARQKIAAVGDTSNASRLGSLLADRTYSSLSPLPSKNFKELEAAAYLAASTFPISPRDLLPTIPKVELNLPAKITEVTSKCKYAILFPGASWQPKRWPLERFASVGNYLKNQFGFKIIICGDKSEQEESDEVSRKIPSSISLAGVTTLPMLIEVVRGAEIVVSNDTSAAHIAAATGTDCIAVLGGGHFGRFLPYPLSVKSRHEAIFSKMSCFGCNWQCSQKMSGNGCLQCIDRISVSEVQAKVTDYLSQRCFGTGHQDSGPHQIHAKELKPKAQNG